MKRQKRVEMQMRAQLHIVNERGETFVGLRPTYFKDKSKYHRNDEKAKCRKMCKEY